MKSLILSMMMLMMSTSLYAQKFAKATLVKGKVFQQVKGKSIPIKKNQWFKQGDILKSSKKSVAKFMLTDKSVLTLGPNSAIKISKNAKKGASVISLIKGSLQSKVRKNYRSKDKNKMIIKTKTAAIGVRGTEFLSRYNPDTQVTSNITYSGEVRMVGIDSLDQISYGGLVEALNSNDIVTINAGELSTVEKGQTQPSKPITLSPIDVYMLKQKIEKPTSASTSKKINMPKGISYQKFIKGGYAKVVALPSVNEALGEKVIEVEEKPEVQKKELVQSVASTTLLDEADEVEEVAEMTTAVPLQNIIQFNVSVQ